MNAAGLLAVFTGGGIGAVLRFAVTFAMTQRLGPGFPWATFFINITGSFFIGVCAELIVTRAQIPSPLLRLFFMTGVLGGYTTFSTFSLDTLNLVGDRAFLLAVAYAGGSVILGIIAALGGLAFARWL